MPSNLIQEFKDDPIYSPFLAQDFDPQAHASHLVQGVVIAEHLSKLSFGINKLEKEIEDHVGSHYEDLLSQASGVQTLEDVLNTMHSRIQTLLAGVERLRSRVVEPFNKIQQQTLILGRLQATCELLRRVIRCLSLSQRLQEQITNGVKDITKSATSLSELDALGKDVDLSGLEILEKDQRFIRQSRSDVEKQASIMFNKGMESQNQTQVGTALQVFYNLNMLTTSVEKVLNGLTKQLEKDVEEALNVKLLTQISQDAAGFKGNSSIGPGKAILPVSGQSAQFRANLWSGLEKLMDAIYNVCVKTSHLHKVLSKKRDPLTQVCFLDEIYAGDQQDLFTRVWREVTKILTEGFSRAVNGSNLIRQALEVDYPKLLRLYGDLWKKLEGISNDVRTTQLNAFATGFSFKSEGDSDKKADQETPFDPEKALRNSLTTLERAYITRSLSRLLDAVNLMFSAPVVPSKDEVDTLIKTIISELSVSAVDKTLSETIAKNIVKTLNLFCQKCEQLLVTDGEASQVIGPPTAGQNLNAKIVNQLFYLKCQVERTSSATLAHLPQPVIQTVLTGIPNITSLMGSAIDPLFSSMNAAVEAIILTMHREDFSSSKAATDFDESQCSLYMKELQGFVTRATNDYISPFTLSSIIKEKMQSLACLSLEMFLRHASLLRPVGENGKLRLAADFAQMEMTISPLSSRPSELGRSYRILRAFRPLLFQTPEHIGSSGSLGDVIPYSLVLHFLFSRAPPELRSPHQTAGWSESRYSSWLDAHQSESERLQLVQGALEAYVASVRSKNITQFAPVYPVMLDLLGKGVCYNTSQDGRMGQEKEKITNSL